MNHLTRLLTVTLFAGLIVGCDLSEVAFHLGSATMSPGEEGAIPLVYREGDLVERLGGICGFEIHWRYDVSSLRFPDCEGPSASHSCGGPRLSGGHPGLLCVCNASAPGHMEVAAIVADGVTPLPAGPVVIGDFRVSAEGDAPPDIYPLEFERPDDEHPTISYVLCEGAQLGAEGMRFWDGAVILLE